MTKPLPFTESSVRRAVSAARKAGLDVAAESVTPDGVVIVYRKGDAPQPPPNVPHAPDGDLENPNIVL